MKLKYVMFVTQIGSNQRAIPLMFFEPVTHVDMFNLGMTMLRDQFPKLRSAGFVTMTAAGLRCYGESGSLRDSGQKNYRSLPDDNEVIFHYNYMHGII